MRACLINEHLPPGWKVTNGQFNRNYFYLGTMFHSTRAQKYKSKEENLPEGWKNHQTRHQDGLHPESEGAQHQSSCATIENMIKENFNPHTIFKKSEWRARARRGRSTRWAPCPSTTSLLLRRVRHLLTTPSRGGPGGG